MKKLTFLSIIIIFFFSCKKPENRTCFKSTGSIVSKEISLPSFDKLILNEHLIYHIVQDSTNKVILTGGKNLLNEVKFTINQDNALEIANKNKCNFLRNYKKKIRVEIHLTSLVNVEFIGSDSLTNSGILNVDYLTFVVKDGAGSANLKINAKYLNAVVTGGYGDFTISGKTDAAKIIINGNGSCNTSNLEIQDSIIGISNTAVPIKLNTSNALFRTQIKSNGDILYKGSPSKIDFTNFGSGKLIHEN